MFSKIKIKCKIKKITATADTNIGISLESRNPMKNNHSVVSAQFDLEYYDTSKSKQKSENNFPFHVANFLHSAFNNHSASLQNVRPDGPGILQVELFSMNKTTRGQKRR